MADASIYARTLWDRTSAHVTMDTLYTRINMTAKRVCSNKIILLHDSLCLIYFKMSMKCHISLRSFVNLVQFKIIIIIIILLLFFLLFFFFGGVRWYLSKQNQLKIEQFLHCNAYEMFGLLAHPTSFRRILRYI